VQTNKSDFLDCRGHCEAVQVEDAFCADQDRGAAGSTSAASGARALGDATYRSGQPDSQPSSGTRVDSAQRPDVMDQQLPRILERRRAEVVGFLSCSVGAAQDRTRNTHRTHRGDGSGHPENGQENEACQRLTEIPGVGPVTATALIGAVGKRERISKRTKSGGLDGDRSGEYSTGGKQKYGHSKRGNKYLRTLFIKGAQRIAAATQASSRSQQWLAQLLARAHQNVVIVALANKLVRMAWRSYVRPTLSHSVLAVSA